MAVGCDRKRHDDPRVRRSAVLDAVQGGDRCDVPGAAHVRRRDRQHREQCRCTRRIAVGKTRRVIEQHELGSIGSEVFARVRVDSCGAREIAFVQHAA